MTPPDDGRMGQVGFEATVAGGDDGDVWNRPDPPSVPVPTYLREIYGWAYLHPVNARLLDREAVVRCLLFGNSGRLRRALLAELAPGQRVLQAAHVYGRLIPDMAERLGPHGELEVIDVAPLQVDLCRRKVRDRPQVRVRLADAEQPGTGRYDVVSCFFLLHELPDAQKRTVVDALLRRLGPGGKAVFVDYHAPVAGHPLRGLMSRVFDRLEPFAAALWTAPIAAFASRRGDFEWRTRTMFGGLYQVTTATCTTE